MFEASLSRGFLFLILLIIQLGDVVVTDLFVVLLAYCMCNQSIIILMHKKISMNSHIYKLVDSN